MDKEEFVKWAQSLPEDVSVMVDMLHCTSESSHPKPEYDMQGAFGAQVYSQKNFHQLALTVTYTDKTAFDFMRDRFGEPMYCNNRRVL